MGELERDVRPQPFCVDAVEQLAVGVDDLARLGLFAHALAEQRRVREQALLVQSPQTGTAASRLSPATKRAAPRRKP
jgi:hypothetical protein